MFRIIFVLFSLVCIAIPFEIYPRIVKGNSSKRGQFPFFALLRSTKVAPNDRFICGGTLLNEHFVLTAAHCLNNATKVEIHLGSLRKNEIEIGRQLYYVRPNFFHVHPEYINGKMSNDMALIRLPQPAIYSIFVKPAIFPDMCDLFDLVDGMNLTVIGNGKDGNEGEMAETLQHTTLTTTSSSECKEIYSFINRNKIFCAKGSFNESICGGDSGGPIVHPITHTIFGVSSFTHASGCDGIPQGFSNIFAFLPWISEITGIKFKVCNH